MNEAKMFGAQGTPEQIKKVEQENLTDEQRLASIGRANEKNKSERLNLLKNLSDRNKVSEKSIFKPSSANVIKAESMMTDEQISESSERAKEVEYRAERQALHDADHNYRHDSHGRFLKEKHNIK